MSVKVFSGMASYFSGKHKHVLGLNFKQRTISFEVKMDSLSLKLWIFSIMMSLPQPATLLTTITTSIIKSTSTKRNFKPCFWRRDRWRTAGRQRRISAAADVVSSIDRLFRHAALLPCCHTLWVTPCGHESFSRRQDFWSYWGLRIWLELPQPHNYNQRRATNSESSSPRFCFPATDSASQFWVILPEVFVGCLRIATTSD